MLTTLGEIVGVVSGVLAIITTLVAAVRYLVAGSKPTPKAPPSKTQAEGVQPQLSAPGASPDAGTVSMVQNAGKGLIAIGILGLLSGAYVLVASLILVNGNGPDDNIGRQLKPAIQSNMVMVIALLFFQLFSSVLAVVAGFNMGQLRMYWFCVFACAAAFIAGGILCSFASIPVAIWCSSVLMMPRVRNAFDP